MSFRFVVATLLLGFLSVPRPSTAQEVVPRYKLQVGQEIQYQELDEPRYDAGGGWHFEKTWTLWVIAHNGDGAWRVIGRHTFMSHRLNWLSQTPNDSTLDIGRFNVYPDGRIDGNPDEIAGCEPYVVFPQLPERPRDKIWQSKIPTFAYSALPDQAPNDFAFDFEDHRNVNGFYVITHTGTLHFDLQCGLLASATDDWVQGYPRKSTGTGALTLKSVRVKDAAFIKQLGRESDVYFQATADYHRAAGAAWKDAAHIPPFRQQAKKQLTDARAHIMLPLFADPLDKLLAGYDGLVKEMEKETQENAQRIAAVINKRAAGWQLKDLNGKTHQLSNYRGKVVLLDFWYRGCGYCIDMMPQMKQVADDFKNEPVAVLGMNTDDDEKDAAFIADKMGLNYPTLLAGHVPESYGVDGYPTVILIDPEGIVREIRNGYSPHLREELDRATRQLLPARADTR